MGRQSGNNYAKATSSTPIAINSNGRVMSTQGVKKMLSSVGRITDLPDREVVRQLQQGISRFESKLGLRERVVKTADLSGAYGVTYIGSDGSHGVYLDKKLFSKKRDAIEKSYRRSNYDTGFKNKTNRPIQHTITHELAHSLWTSSYDAPRHRAAGIEIKQLFDTFRRDRERRGARQFKNYGTYGMKNVDEFWAEVITKGVHGNSDRYTRKAIAIAKKYKL